MEMFSQLYCDAYKTIAFSSTVRRASIPKCKKKKLLTNGEACNSFLDLKSTTLTKMYIYAD